MSDFKEVVELELINQSIMKKTSLCFAIILALVFHQSCTKEGDEILTEETSTITQNEEVKSQVAIMKELSIITGHVIKDLSLKKYLINIIEAKKDNSEAISFSTLLGKDDDYSIFERKRLNTDYSKSLDANAFKERFLEIVHNNEKEYPVLSKKLNLNNINNRSSIDLTQFESDEYQVYFPYSENFKEEEIVEYTTSWHPIITDETNEGNKFSPLQNTSVISVSSVDDEYAYENPSFLIIPIDSCDDPQILKSDDPNRCWGDIQGDGSSGNNSATGRFLTENVDHTTVTQEDVVKVIIPWIRITEQTSGIFQPTRLTLYRASGDLEFGDDGLLVPSATSFRILYKKHIKRRWIRKKQWVDIDITFDGDWDVHENTEQLVVFTHHTFSGEVSVSGSVKIGWDNDNNQSTFEPTASGEFTLTSGNSKLRYNNEISRRDVLSHIVGDTGAGSIHYPNDNADYSIRKADLMDYFFRIYYTDI